MRAGGETKVRGADARRRAARRVARGGLLALLACAAVVLSLAQSPPQQQARVRTDRRVYAAPAPPRLPNAGGKFFDPTFGTEIMRVTDEATTGGRSAGTSYSYWPTFNSDSTRLVALRDEREGGVRGVVYEFDPANFRLGLSYDLPPAPNTRGQTVRNDDAIWSASDPHTLYAHSETRIYAFDARTRSFRVRADLSRHLPAGEYLYQMSKDDSDDVFAFTRRGPAPAYAFVGWIVYRVSTDSVVRLGPGPIDECQLDKTGRYLVWKTGEQGAGKINVRVVDLQTGAVTDLRDDGPDYAPGHSGNGRGTIVGADNWVARVTGRSLSSPRQFVTVLDLAQEKEWGAYHVSMLADDERWALVGFHGWMANGVMQGEIVQVATDGSGRVRRLLHHRSVYQDYYYDQPRANISRDGRFVAFTSNWGKSRGRRDLFVARVEPPQTRPRRVAAIWLLAGRLARWA